MCIKYYRRLQDGNMQVQQWERRGKQRASRTWCPTMRSLPLEPAPFRKPTSPTASKPWSRCSLLQLGQLCVLCPKRSRSWIFSERMTMLQSHLGCGYLGEASYNQCWLTGCSLSLLLFFATRPALLVHRHLELLHWSLIGPEEEPWRHELWRFPPVPGCPCTPRLLCETEARRRNSGEGLLEQLALCSSAQPPFPGTLFSIHGGAGKLISGLGIRVIELPC